MEARDTRVNGLTIVKPRDIVDAEVRGGGAPPCAARNQQVTGGQVAFRAELLLARLPCPSMCAAMRHRGGFSGQWEAAP